MYEDVHQLLADPTIEAAFKRAVASRREVLQPLFFIKSARDQGVPDWRLRAMLEEALSEKKWARADETQADLLETIRGSDRPLASEFGPYLQPYLKVLVLGAAGADLLDEQELLLVPPIALRLERVPDLRALRQRLGMKNPKHRPAGALTSDIPIEPLPDTWEGLVTLIDPICASLVAKRGYFAALDLGETWAVSTDTIGRLFQRYGRTARDYREHWRTKKSRMK